MVVGPHVSTYLISLSLLHRPPPSLSLPCLSVGRSWRLLPTRVGRDATLPMPAMVHPSLPAPARRILRTAAGLCATAEDGQRTAAGFCAAVEEGLCMASEKGLRMAGKQPAGRGGGGGSSRWCLEQYGPVELRWISPLLPMVLCFSRSVVLLLLRTAPPASSSIRARLLPAGRTSMPVAAAQPPAPCRLRRAEEWQRASARWWRRGYAWPRRRGSARQGINLMAAVE
jgi:hypothetical protein